MQLTWVNHASCIINYDGVKMISDPWLSGTVFNNSWAHLAESKFTVDDYKTITHIWFSHEHPDHFFPPNLIKIPKEVKQNITVLYQQTIDKKVKSFCEKAGFKEVIELQPWQPFQLTDKIILTCSKVSNDTDSWLHIKTPDLSILNVNDCVFKHEIELQKIKETCGAIDLLFAQFSFASWVGNSNDLVSKYKAAEDKKHEMAKLVKTLQPKYTIPFASYVWFCTPENFHMNKQANSIDAIYTFMKHIGTIPIIMYPGDEWQVGAPYNSETAIEKYLIDLKQLPTRQLTQFETISIADLKAKATKFQHATLSKNNKQKLNGYAPFTAYLTDLDVVVAFSYKHGLQVDSVKSKHNADIAFCSQNLAYCFDFDWGMGTIIIAGTFEKPEGGNYQNFLEYEWIGHLNNSGKRMEGLLKRLMTKMAAK